MLLAAQYVSLIAVCIYNESNLIMHLTVWHKQANLAGFVNYPLGWYYKWKCYCSGSICTARVQHDHVTNAQSINHGLMSNITMVATVKATSAIGIL